MQSSYYIAGQLMNGWGKNEVKKKKPKRKLTLQETVWYTVKGFYLVVNCNQDVNPSGFGKHRVQVKK